MIIENAMEGADLIKVLSEAIAKSDRISFCVSFLCYSGYALLIKKLQVDP